MRWTVHMPHDNAERGGNAVEAIFLGFKWAQSLDNRFSSTASMTLILPRVQKDGAK